MIISKTQVQNILKVYAKEYKGSEAERIKPGQGVLKKDELNISSESRLKHRVMQAVKQSDDIREDRVQELQQQIATGTYEVSADQVAEKIIERAIVDKLV